MWNKWLIALIVGALALIGNPTIAILDELTTGLDPAAYFGLADRAFGSIAIPDALKTPESAPSMSAA